MNKTTDKSNMRHHIAEFPKQLSVGYEAAKNTGKEFSEKEIDNIVVAGMGGSALPGLLLQMLGPRLSLQLPVTVRRNYTLPESTQSTLVVVISYSGNTAEALSVYKEAQKRGLPLAVITTDGTLASYAEEGDTPAAIIPDGPPPRLGLGYQFAALVRIVENTGLLPSQAETIKATASTLSSEKLEDKGYAMAGQLGSAIPLFYASDAYAALAYIFKIQVNENAKRHAFMNVFPELNHNELVGFEDQQRKDLFQVYILRADDDHPNIRKRTQLTADILREKEYDTHIIDIQGENLYNKVFETVLLGAWFSYYIAINNGIDPAPTDIIENFKKKLG